MKYLNPYKAIQILPEHDLFPHVKKIVPEARVIHILTHTPSQFEDIYAFLVDDNLYVSFEIERYRADYVSSCSYEAKEIETMHIESYRRYLRGSSAKEFKVIFQNAKYLLSQIEI